MPEYLKAASQTKRVFLTWFVAKAAYEALGKQIFNGLDFVRPERFSSRQPAS